MGVAFSMTPSHPGGPPQFGDSTGDSDFGRPSFSSVGIQLTTEGDSEQLYDRVLAYHRDLLQRAQLKEQPSSPGTPPPTLRRPRRSLVQLE